MLVKLVQRDGRYVPDRFVRATDFSDKLAQANNPDWKTVAVDEKSGKSGGSERLDRFPLGADRRQVESGREEAGEGRRSCACR